MSNDDSDHLAYAWFQPSPVLHGVLEFGQPEAVATQSLEAFPRPCPVSSPTSADRRLHPKALRNLKLSHVMELLSRCQPAHGPAPLLFLQRVRDARGNGT